MDCVTLRWRTLLILLVLGVVLAMTLGTTQMGPTIESVNADSLLPNSSPVLSDQFESNGTLVADGVTITYEDATISQAGNIRVLNGGKLVLRNATLRFIQLTGYQYDMRIENRSEVVIEDSTIDSKYPFTWTILESNVTMDSSAAWQSKVGAWGHSDISLCQSMVSGASIHGSVALHATLGSITQVTLGGTSYANLSGIDCERLSASASSRVSIHSSTVSEIILSDTCHCELTNSDSVDIHLWDSSSLNTYQCIISGLEMYDSSSGQLVSSGFGQVVIRSSEEQVLESLTIDSLTCGGDSSTTARNCHIETVDVWEATLAVHDSSMTDVFFGYRTQGIVNHSVLSSLISSHGAILSVIEVNASSIECSRNAVTRIESTRSNLIDAWNFDGGNTSIVESEIETLWVRWDTIFNMTDSIVTWASIWDRSIVEIRSSNFTDYILLSSSSEVALRECVLARLYTRHTTDVVLVGCTVCWRVEPDWDTHRIDTLPLGYVELWNPLLNASFDSVTYNITFLQCNVSGLEISIGRDIECEILNSEFAWATVFDTANVTFTGCNFTYLETAGYAYLVGCRVDEMVSHGASTGFAVSCLFGVWHLWGAPYWNVELSNFTHIEVGGNSYLEFVKSNSNSLWVTGYGNAELRGSYVWQIRTYNYIHIYLEDCTVDIWYNAYTQYPVASAKNCTIGTVTAIAYTTLTLVDCTVVYFGTGDSGSTIVENCTFEQFVIAGDAYVLVKGNFSWSTYYSIRDSAEVERRFYLEIAFDNATSCSWQTYFVLDDTNQTLLTGQTSSDGTAEFALHYFSINLVEFVAQYHVDATRGAYAGSQSFDTTTLQPLVVVLTESLGEGSSTGEPLLEQPDSFSGVEEVPPNESGPNETTSDLNRLLHSEIQQNLSTLFVVPFTTLMAVTYLKRKREAKE